METQTNNLKQQKKYFYEIGFIRAIACLCIVMVHVTAGFYYENNRTFSGVIQFLNQISRYGTPAFAIISGFLLYNQTIKKGFQFRKFLQSRFTKIVIPFLIWSLIYLLLKWQFNQFEFPTINSSQEVKEFLYILFTGKSNYHLYFIVIVVQFYLLFPLLQFIRSKQSLIFLTLVSFFINYFFVKYKIEIGTGLFNQFINDRVFILHWIYYFLLGGLLVYYWERIIFWVRQNTIFSMLLGVIIIIGGVFEYSLSEWVESNRVMNMINLPLLFIAFAGVYVSLSSCCKVRDYIVEIGNLSMGIYLIHPFILFLLRRYDIFKMFYVHTGYLPLVYLFTLVSSIVLVKIIVKLPFGNYVVTVARSNKQRKVKTGAAKSISA